MAGNDFIAAKHCRTCGIEKPHSEFYKAACCKDGLRGECKACVAAKQADYNRKYADRIAAKKKESYYAEGADEVRKGKSAAYYQANRDRLMRRAREHHARAADAISERRKSNRAKLHLQAMAWRAANVDRVREATRAWYHANKDRLRLSRKTAKAMRRAAGVIDATVVSFLMQAQRGKCAVCKTSIAESTYHLDHIKPLSRGGTNQRTNLQLLCPPCNLSKSAKDPIDFMQSRGYLL